MGKGSVLSGFARSFELSRKTILSSGSGILHATECWQQRGYHHLSMEDTVFKLFIGRDKRVRGYFSQPDEVRYFLMLHCTLIGAVSEAKKA